LLNGNLTTIISGIFLLAFMLLAWLYIKIFFTIVSLIIN
jgi:hypothetical protein